MFFLLQGGFSCGFENFINVLTENPPVIIIKGTSYTELVMLMVGANSGIVGTTKEHLGLALALSLPVFVVITKIDMCPFDVLQETLKLLVRMLRAPGCRKFPIQKIMQRKYHPLIYSTDKA